jgi:hypothetical protein
MTLRQNMAAMTIGNRGMPRIRAPQVAVSLDGVTEPRLRLDRVEMAFRAGPRAWFAAGFGRTTAGDDLRIETLARHVRPGQTVRATLLRGGVGPGDAGGDLVIFEGRVGQIELALGPDDEGLWFEAENAGIEVLRRRVSGQRVRTAEGDALQVNGLPLIFNPDGRPNASAQDHEFEDGSTGKLFAPDASDAVAWTLNEAVAYLMREYGAAANVEPPSREEVGAAVEPQILSDVSVEGLTLEEALSALLAMAGAELSVAAEPGAAEPPESPAMGWRLEVWRRDRAASGWLAHQPVGQAFAPSVTNFCALSATMRFDRSPRRYEARGDLKIYESTFDLVAGWDDALLTSDPDDFSPSTNPDFDAVRDVMRKWALNEAGDYSGAPWNRGPAPNLIALFDGAACAGRRRRLLPCISCDDLRRSRGIYVELSLDGGTTWERMTQNVRVLTDECGLYLTDDPLPARYVAAAMRQNVRIRVTASVESDARLKAEYGDEDDTDLPGQTRHLSLAAGYRFRRVAPSSRFYGSGSAHEVDDTAKLEARVRAAWEADRASPAPATVEVPYLALGYRVGQCLAGVSGRAIDLKRETRGHAAAPVIRRVRHTFSPLPKTELELE